MFDGLSNYYLDLIYPIVAARKHKKFIGFLAVFIPSIAVMVLFCFTCLGVFYIMNYFFVFDTAHIENIFAYFFVVGMLFQEFFSFVFNMATDSDILFL